MVYLDCEGLGSWERTESEDMLLALVSAAMASLTMFKTHFDFNRYTRRCGSCLTNRTKCISIPHSKCSGKGHVEVAWNQVQHTCAVPK
jgi:hypothetical protein